ncbi:unnamed protein product [Sphenostylis stenocarpa]|uniref:Uncharacterized protein n=1 Tax=Sphenostylis stenocarpa TaxID=92480 RepID=A0AA86RY37_9FABA|nr:unnamed protein product [Sphenostylis stenocarpa]
MASDPNFSDPLISLSLYLSIPLRGYERKFENNAEFHELRAVCSISWRRRLISTMHFAPLKKLQRKIHTTTYDDDDSAAVTENNCDVTSYTDATVVLGLSCDDGKRCIGMSPQGSDLNTLEFRIDLDFR